MFNIYIYLICGTFRMNTQYSGYSHKDYMRPWVHENKHLSHLFRTWFSKARAHLHLSTFKENISVGTAFP